MALILTPGQLSDRADFYHQIDSLLRAGYGLPAALDHLRLNPPARSYVQPLQGTLSYLHEGYSFADSLKHQGTWLPEFDIALLEAGEKSGRLDACMSSLAEYYKERAGLVRTLIRDSAYPALLIHAALFILAIPGLILGMMQQTDGNPMLTFFLRTFGILIPIYVLVFLLIYFSQSSRGRGIRGFIEAGLNIIPIIGTGRKHMALARLAMSLDALMNAGVLVTTAWMLSAKASGSLRIEKEVSSWIDRIEAGVPPSELLRDNPVFPEVFSNLYRSGEVSGRLDDHLQKLQIYYLESGTAKMRTVATWVPRIVYFGVVLYIAYSVISFWSGYFQMVGDAGGFGN